MLRYRAPHIVPRHLGAGHVRSFMKSSFFSNSFYNMLAHFISSGFGLVFWVLAAISYTQAEVGVATALVSSVGVILLIARLGIDQTMMRYLPGSGNRSSVYSSSNIVMTIFSIIVGVVYVLTAKLWTPNLDLDWGMAVVFILLIYAQSVSTTSNFAFISLRKSRTALLQTIMMGSRIPLLFVMVALGSIGIIGAYTLSFFIAVLFGQWALAKLGIFRKEVDWKFIRETFGYSSGTWISNLLSNLPTFVLPIMVLAALGAEQTAEYYMAFSFASIIYIFPRAMSNQLFVEGCHGESLRGIVIKTLALSYLVMAPVFVALYLAAPWLLGILGSDYAEGGLNLVRLLAVSSVFQISFSVYSSLKMVQKDMRGLLVMSLFKCAMVIGLSYLLMLPYGLDGIGYAWIIAHAITNLIILILALRGGSRKWITTGTASST